MSFFDNALEKFKEKLKNCQENVYTFKERLYIYIYIYIYTRLLVTRWVKLSLNFELPNIPYQLY